MKIKKIASSLMVSTLCIMTALSGVSAANTYDTNKVLDAADKAKEYYKENGLTQYAPNQWGDNLSECLNDIIAYEALGGEVEDDFSNYFTTLENHLNTSSVGTISKEIIATKLLKKDPSNLTINGATVNLVKELEDKVQTNGCLGNTEGNNIDIWALLALESVSSSKVDLVANHIASDINPDGGFWNFDYYDPSQKDSSCDVTGWGIEALSIAGKQNYSTTIQKAINYLQSNQDDKAGYLSYGSANPDTQACVVEGLSVYNRESLLNGNYNKNQNPLDVLLSYQNENGSFCYDAAGEINSYATQDAARALGVIVNGSVIYKAKGTGNPDGTLKRVETKKDPASQPSSNEDKKDSQTTKTNEVATAVKTGDNTNIVVFASLSIISGGLFLVLRKENEKAHQ